MKMLTVNQAMTLSIFVIVVLIGGVSGVSYGNVCQVGDVLSPGESCTYPGTDIEFSVLANGSGRFLFFTAGTGINARNVTINGVKYNFAASKRADGKWEIEAVPGGGDPQTPIEEPDLVVTSVSSSDTSVSSGERFTLSATVRNQGTGESTATTLRYYRSTNNSISANDTAVGSDSVSGLRANRTSNENVSLTAPTTPGTYYYGVCVDSVTDESDTANNCSIAVRVTVTAPPRVPENVNEGGVVDVPVINTGGVATLSVSAPSLLTEQTLHESVVTLNLSGGTYERSRIDIGDALRVSGVPGVTIGTFGTAWFGVDRINDTEITVELGFNGNIDTDATLNFTLGADAIADYNGPAVTGTVRVTAVKESVAVSVPSPLTEQTLHESVVTLTLSGRTYEPSYKIRNAVSVSGVVGVSIVSWRVSRVSDTEITVELEFSGNMDTDSTLTFTIDADAITNYNASALTAEIPVSASRKWVVASSAVLLTETTLDGSVVTLTLSGQTYEPFYNIRNAVSVSGIPGVSVTRHNVDRISDVEVAVELEYDGNRPPRGTLIFTIKADAIANYKGPVLKAHLSVPTQLERDENRDVNGDGAVSIQDLILVAFSFGKTGDHPSDVNGDGSVDIKDLILIAGVLDAGAAAPSLYPESLEILTPADLQLWLSQAHHLALRDAASQRGIRFLEQLLAVLTPTETMLLANYPNPFNPETWIPYQLARDADVTITIYAMNGHVVRRLALGHQAAGMYKSRSRAAYWNGKNEFGEPVSSGVYFYTLAAGDFSVTRKMLIRK